MRKGTLDKAPFLIISNVIWVLSSDTDPGVELRIWLKQGKEKSLLARILKNLEEARNRLSQKKIDKKVRKLNKKVRKFDKKS